MLGQKVDYSIEVDGGKSKSGTVISFYTGVFISITEYGTMVFHNAAKQYVIYSPKNEGIPAFIPQEMVKEVDEELLLKKVEDFVDKKLAMMKQPEPATLTDAIFGVKEEVTVQTEYASTEEVPVVEEVVSENEITEEKPKKKSGKKK